MVLEAIIPKNIEAATELALTLGSTNSAFFFKEA
jgi:hypothetical protein